MRITYMLVCMLGYNTFQAQTVIRGNYQFNRQEMVAGFSFAADGHFEFYYSYGAADRSATGTFYVVGDTLKLKSDKEPGKDFSVTSQTKSGTGYTIKFEHQNKYLLRNIRCVFFRGEEKQEVFTDENGVAKSAFPRCDKIYAQHALFPDILTLVKDDTNANNVFTVALNASLGHVSFKGIDFKIEDENTISCVPNYFMMLDNIKFRKQ